MITAKRRRPSPSCGHGVGGAGSFGAEHADVDITSAQLLAAGQDDPKLGTPGAQVFYIDSNVVNGEPNVLDFLGDSGIPAEARHCSFHPVAANVIAARATRSDYGSRCGGCAYASGSASPVLSAGVGSASRLRWARRSALLTSSQPSCPSSFSSSMYCRHFFVC